MEMVMTNGFAELNANEIDYINGGGLKSALWGALAGAGSGLLFGGQTGAKLDPTGGTVFWVCVGVGTVGGACTGFVTGW